MDAGFREWVDVVGPNFEEQNGNNDECFVVIFTDEPDQGQYWNIQ